MKKQMLLGDWAAFIMLKTGVTKVVGNYFPQCNCETRRKWLNKWHRRIFGIKQSKYLAVAKDFPCQYAAWCNLDNEVFLTEDKERALHFDIKDECKSWCDEDGAGTPLFVPRITALD